MGSRWLISILLTVMLVASPALPARGQPAAPAQPAPPSPPQAPSLGPIPMIPQVPMLAPRPLTLADAITTGLANNFQTRVAALGVAIAREQLREAVAQEAVTVGGTTSFTANSVSGAGAPLTGTISIPASSINNQSFTATGLTGSGTPATTTTFGLTLRYPLYTGGALESQVTIAQANAALAE